MTSDESVVAKWVENPTGLLLLWRRKTFQHDCPVTNSLPKWRQRVGVEKWRKLLGQVLRTAMNQQALKPSEIARVNVDTTVQKKSNRLSHRCSVG